jgi:Ca2+/Na+ antiporter
MYIIAIAWLYVTFLMAATEASVTAGILTFIFYGLMLMWILGTPQRKRKKALLEEELSQPNRSDSHAD